MTPPTAIGVAVLLPLLGAIGIQLDIGCGLGGIEGISAVLKNPVAELGGAVRADSSTALYQGATFYLLEVLPENGYAVKLQNIP